MADGLQGTIDNLPETTGRSFDEWQVLLAGTGLAKHTELMNYLKSDHGLTHGFANAIVLRFRSKGQPQEDDDLVAAQYSGAKAVLRPIYDAVVELVTGFGPDVEISAKKTGVSLRRAKQFAVIEVPSAKRVQIGIQLKGLAPTERLLTGNAMCSHRVSVVGLEEVDDELAGWLRSAYERAL